LIATALNRRAVMPDFFKWASGSSIATAVLAASFAALVLAVIALYMGAFWQGRDVSFWPPRIGPRPSLAGNDNPAPAEAPRPGEDPAVDYQGPVIRRGTRLRTASGSSLTFEAPLFCGAASTLFKAACPRQGTVIVKVYWHDAGEGTVAEGYFKCEIRVAEALKHRNIVRVLDRGIYGRYPFLVMEYLAGGTLCDLLKTRDRLPGADVLSIAQQVAKALDFAHSKGVVHRDVKPSNILLAGGPGGRVALSDFGVARLMGEEEKRRTTIGGLIGTPLYVAPELIQGAQATPAADIYSFSLVLFELIAGKKPYDHWPDPWSLLMEKVHGKPPDLTAFPSVPDRLAAQLSQALSSDPCQRPPTAAAVLEGVEKLIRQL
jgi:serine/threonine protein kinase